MYAYRLIKLLEMFLDLYYAEIKAKLGYTYLCIFDCEIK